MPRRVLLAGGSGMIGANLARALLQRGDEVTVLSRPKAERWRLKQIEQEIRVVDINYSDANLLESVIDRAAPDVLFHLASTPFNPPTISAEAHFEANVSSVIHQLEAMRALGSEAKFIFAGSAAAYGQGENLMEDGLSTPETLLGAAKQSARITLEVYAKLYGIKTTNLCLFTPFGPWESASRLIPHIILSSFRGQPIEMTDGLQQRDFLFVDDVVNAFIRASLLEVDGGMTINVCSGRPTPVRELARMLLDFLGKNVDLKLGALPTRADEIRVVSGNNERSHSVLDWQPEYPLEAGLERTVEWFRKHARLYD